VKIAVGVIVRDHFRTLYDKDAVTASVGEFSLFYGLPVIIAMLGYFQHFSLKPDGYNVSITFFGIFIALLLNIQVAIFAIFQRKWDKPLDPIEVRTQERVIATRRALLEELNANISYLVLVCCVALTATVVFYIATWVTGAAPAFTLFLYAHFLLTLLMIVRSSHALFQREYRE